MLFANLIELALKPPHKPLSLVTTIINTFSTWNQLEGYSSLPIFEVKSAQEFPMEATFIPMFKRKIMTYIFQVVNMEVLKNFDSDVQI